ncbi:MAG TPA: nucleotide-binding protein [Actinocrinis sp.]|nr:nucleotide-binding protein [Actinocrinis sp.]
MDSMRFGNVTANGEGAMISQGNSGNQTLGAHSPIGWAPGDDDFDEESADEGSDQAAGPAAAGPAGADKTRSVFVVHGRDEQVRQAMFGLLGRLGLRGLEWEELVRATGHTVPFLGDVVVNAPAQAQAALVLLTPDDVAMLHPDLLQVRDQEYEGRLTGQARPNVLLELGMVLMAYPERTVIVEVGALRPIADLAGRNVIRFDGSVASVKKIAERLDLAGCRVNQTGSDWLDPGPFHALKAYQR